MFVVALFDVVNLPPMFIPLWHLSYASVFHLFYDLFVVIKSLPISMIILSLSVMLIGSLYLFITLDFDFYHTKCRHVQHDSFRRLMSPRYKIMPLLVCSQSPEPSSLRRNTSAWALFGIRDWRSFLHSHSA